MEGNPGRAPRLVGVVVNCLDLTIRKSPGNEAEVTGHLSVLTEVLVDMDKSTEDFYRVLARKRPDICQETAGDRRRLHAL
mgnify:CR=1 FL=1